MLPRLVLAVLLMSSPESTVDKLPVEPTESPVPPPEVVADWKLQDGWRDRGRGPMDSVRRVIDALGQGQPATELRAEFERLRRSGIPAADPRWEALFQRACQRRRQERLALYRRQIRRVVFTKHYDLGGSHYAYTEGLSDAQNERHFQPGSELCLLEMDGLYGQTRTLIADPDGVIRDPAVSWDGQRIVFAWKKSDRLDDYHLYEFTVASGKVRQLTFGLGVADYEPAYLPNGDIVFASTRCIQTVDCWWTEVSNLYTCDVDGRYLRRLTVDQVHTNFPTVTPDGRVIYTRWDYSDRGQIYPQGLFQMNPDGTGQTELYGNSSWFPTTIAHARAIPHSQRVVAIFTGHHTHQRGHLGILDPNQGQQENSGAQLIAPVRPTPAVRIDAYGQDGPQFQYPYPLSDEAFLVAMDPIGSDNRTYPRPYAIYWVDVEGHRELLVADPQISCNQPILLLPRRRPPVQATRVDYSQRTGVYYLQDVYAGAGLTGVSRGTIKSLRVVAIGFRAAGIGANVSQGVAGGALASTPVSIGNGCWDTKTILGEATVQEDGSACFRVPARTPVYFQALDGQGHAVQTMRSWSTLQPGEQFSCVGCHETKQTTPLSSNSATMAMKNGPQQLVDTHHLAGAFSFAKKVQPILDRHCVECHCDRTSTTGNDLATQADQSFSLLGEEVVDHKAKRRWSDAYLRLTQAVPDDSGNGYVGDPDGRWVKWMPVQSSPEGLPPYLAGSARSPLLELLRDGHAGVRLSERELRVLAAWIDLLVPFCGDYTEAHAWSEAEQAFYAKFQAKRERLAAMEQRNIPAFLARGHSAGWLSDPRNTQARPDHPYENVATASALGGIGPQATSNRESRQLEESSAGCAIDGRTEPQEATAWRPKSTRDAWWKVEFDGTVAIDKLVAYLQVDSGCDDWWQAATIEFSDGSRVNIDLAPTEEPQRFPFEPRTVDWLCLRGIVAKGKEPSACGLTELQVWGRRLEGKLSQRPTSKAASPTIPSSS